MRKITGIILHCTATRPEFMDGQTTATKADEIRRWHVEGNGWSDIGYHYLVDRDGTVATGRPIDRTGAHVRGHNTGTIGISLLGGHGSAETDAFAEHFTDRQDTALRTLLADLQDRFGAVPITGHNDYAAKACPGFNVARWLDKGPTAAPAPEAVDAATEATVYRWRLAEIRDTADRALAGA
ncbi:lysozyme [Mesobaculum littorinae]|uniref:Lysozyme n=1 Tax=Mesobaculum littorinae TaxID=2486419 RepID=A0A438ALR2_9RHOB|nr:N-acetylmuramoyl-L-alanine amidase [Mesobaculum littorinae]RVV99688.1 lysozyme [Mesobaculum littorinae]